VNRAEGVSHSDQIRDVERGSEGCERSRALGDTWVLLRMCITCGQVGCCNSSKNKHAHQHADEPPDRPLGGAGRTLDVVLRRRHGHGIVVVGEQWSLRSHEARNLLEPNGIPYAFYPADSKEGRELLARVARL
jgi:hypothetical protein